MKVKVDPQKSVCDGGVWYNQGDVFDAKDYEAIKDSVTPVDADPAQEFTNDEEEVQ